MKQSIVILMSAALLVSGCSSYSASGAMVGGNFGHVIGSAVGGISGGWRGQHVGSLIGTVGGVIAGAAVGAAVEQSQQRAYERATQRDTAYQGQADDRIDFDGADDPSVSYGTASQGAYPGGSQHQRSISAEALSRRPALEVRNARIYDSDNNGVLTRGEQCTVVFEIMNNTPNVIYDVQPFVEDVTGNKHVKVSPSLHVESIAPNKGIRYTASILADNRLKDGQIVLRLGVVQGQKEVASQAQQYTVPTRKRSPRQ